jgi:hypothetical protein
VVALPSCTHQGCWLKVKGSQKLLPRAAIPLSCQQNWLQWLITMIRYSVVWQLHSTPTTSKARPMTAHSPTNNSTGLWPLFHHQLPAQGCHIWMKAQGQVHPHFTSSCQSRDHLIFHRRHVGGGHWHEPGAISCATAWQSQGQVHTGVALSCSFIHSPTHSFHTFPVGAFVPVCSFFPPTTPFCEITFSLILVQHCKCAPHICPCSSSQVSQSNIPGVYQLCACDFSRLLQNDPVNSARLPHDYLHFQVVLLGTLCQQI